MLATAPSRDHWTPASPEEHSAVLLALEEVLASPYFCNSKRYPALLQYLVAQTLQGRGDELKERTVGVEVFGRRPDYDTNQDTIVRYTAGEVRKRLALYYQNFPNARIQISLTARSYHAEFLRPLPLATDTAPPGSNSTPVAPAAELPAPPPVLSQTPPQSHLRHKRLLVWSLVTSSVLFCALVCLGVRWWVGVRSDVLEQFWAPILSQKESTIISLGGVVFSSSSNIGTEVAQDSTDVNPYLSFENSLAMGRVATLLNARGGSYRVQPSAYTTLAQIREGPTVLVGAYNNPWTLRFLAPLRFHFTEHPDERIVDAKNSSRFWMRDPTKPFNNSEDYAIVARFHNPSTDSIVVVLAGLQRFGTDAASQFATTPDLLRDFDRQAGAGWKDKNIEVVLRVDVVNGRTGAPIVVASEAW